MSFFRPPAAPRSQAVLITEAKQSRQDEMRHRQKRYVATMGFRTVSFIVAVTLPIPVWAKIVLIGGSLVLPWTAVTAANAAPKRKVERPSYDTGERLTEPLQLDPATVVDSTVVEDPADARSRPVPAGPR